MTGKIKMIGLDLDGTVLNSNKEVTENVAGAIERAAEKGIIIVPVTGRPMSGIPDAILNMSGVRYAISSNGALVTDLDDNKICESHFLNRKTAEAILEYVAARDLIFSAFIDGIGFSTPGVYKRQIDMYTGTPLESYVRKSRRPSDIFTDTDRVENIWIRCSGRDEGNEVECFARDKDPGVNILRMLPVDVEIVADTADKGRAFINLAAKLGISQSEIMAVGDGANDVSFMKNAGLSVAMGNAADSIKALSDFITEDNEHDGVAAAIERFCL